ncbi:uncharacterized protein NPIL_96651 [Nephila pilipes]|uniref:Uncharacterized protein n=1 Tax=Nephila pilipes TaxID=299642 RepID=A0A8X6TTK7_NEPPI|nr:uncharacterized protein NPIL_96651 [Nephila pilipes]
MRRRWLRTLINCKIIDYEDFHFCFMRLKPNERYDILRTYSYDILEYFLDWPLQNEFLEVADRMWSYISPHDFIKIFHFIIYQRIMIGWEDYDYIHLLKEFWKLSPANLKEKVMEDTIYKILHPIITHNSFFQKEQLFIGYERDVMFHRLGTKYYVSKRPFLLKLAKSRELRNITEKCKSNKIMNQHNI